MTDRTISVEAINACLPQTQCQLCEYQDCLSYAQAIAKGERLHLCQPGGERTLKALEKVCQSQAGQSAIDHKDHRVVIDEQVCIGCYKCVNACPVSAIVGVAKKMHSVIASDCTGCDLCIPVCPVDCIEPVLQKNPLDYYTGSALAKAFDERKNTYQNNLNKQIKARKTQAKKRQIQTNASHSFAGNKTEMHADIASNKKILGRQSYQIARLNKAINACRRKGDAIQLKKLEKQLQELRAL